MKRPRAAKLQGESMKKKEINARANEKNFKVCALLAELGNCHTRQVQRILNAGNEKGSFFKIATYM
jgi:hypothetical protein